MKLHGLLLCVLLAVPAGCTTAPSRRQTVEMRRRSEIDTLKAKVSRLEEQANDLNTTHERIQREIAELRTQAARDSEALVKRLDGVDQSLQEGATARGRLREEVVADISERMSTLLSERHGGRRGGGESGYQHVVRAGETLSEIASAYGVRAQAIIDANRIANPNLLREGQKLFIPE